MDVDAITYWKSIIARMTGCKELTDKRNFLIKISSINVSSQILAGLYEHLDARYLSLLLNLDLMKVYKHFCNRRHEARNKSLLAFSMNCFSFRNVYKKGTLFTAYSCCGDHWKKNTMTTCKTHKPSSISNKWSLFPYFLHSMTSLFLELSLLAIHDVARGFLSRPFVHNQRFSCSLELSKTVIIICSTTKEKSVSTVPFPQTLSLKAKWVEKLQKKVIEAVIFLLGITRIPVHSLSKMALMRLFWAIIKTHSFGSKYT